MVLNSKLDNTKITKTWLISTGRCGTELLVVCDLSGIISNKIRRVIEQVESMKDGVWFGDQFSHMANPCEKYSNFSLTLDKCFVSEAFFQHG